MQLYKKLNFIYTFNFNFNMRFGSKIISKKNKNKNSLVSIYLCAYKYKKLNK